MTKEKTVELKSKVEKVSEEHLKELQQLVNSLNQAHLQIGRIEQQKNNILRDLVTVQKDVVKMQEVLKKEYGSDDVNLMDVTINWEKDEK